MRYAADPFEDPVRDLFSDAVPGPLNRQQSFHGRVFYGQPQLQRSEIGMRGRALEVVREQDFQKPVCVKRILR